MFARSAAGRRYTALYEEHAGEVARLLAGDPALAGQAAGLLRQWQPAVAGLVAMGRGQVGVSAATERVVSEQDVAAARAVLAALAGRGSPALRADVEPVLGQMDGFVGHTPAEIWAMVSEGGRRVYLPVILKGTAGEAKSREVAAQGGVRVYLPVVLRSWGEQQPGPVAQAAGVQGSGGAPTTHRVITYTYDPLYRLTDAGYSTGEYYRYSYDAVGNRVQLTRDEGRVTSYEYDAANRLTSVNGVGYTWDDNGNLLSDGVRSYGYDHANRLVQVVSGTLTTGFTYNGAWQRNPGSRKPPYSMSADPRCPRPTSATLHSRSVPRILRISGIR